MIFADIFKDYPQNSFFRRSIMRKTIHRLTAAVLSTALFFTALPVSTVYADDEYKEDSLHVRTKIGSINKEGDVILKIKTQTLMNAGFSIGDEVKVKIDKYDYSAKMPFVVTDSDRTTDDVAIVNDDDFAAISVAKGSFAEDADLFTSYTALFSRKTIWKDEDGKIPTGTEVDLYLHKKGSYKNEYDMRNPERTYDRDDYSSDAKYANFRSVKAGLIKEDILFRSSSPINDELNRADYSAEKMEKYGIKCVINLSDDDKKAQKYMEKSENTYYKKLYDEGNVICLQLSYDFDSDEFGEGIAKAVRFMIAHDGPYLVHCTEGKDRTGFLCALLESLMGASVSEMTKDYMQTYKNFYHYENDSKEFKYTKKNYLKEIFRDIANVESNYELKTMDYHKAAVDFLTSYGITADEIAALENKLKDTETKYDEILTLNVSNENTDERGRIEISSLDNPVAVYDGEAVRPGANTLIVNGSYLYRSRDYKISYSDNKHAGTMTMKIKFKKITDIYKSGVKKVTLYYTISPKEATNNNISVRLSKKGKKIKSVKDTELDTKIKSKYYTADMNARTVTFYGDYSGTVSF